MSLLFALERGRRNWPGPSGTLSPAKQWDSGQLVARVVLDHSRPLETRPGGKGAALSVCRNLVRALLASTLACGSMPRRSRAELIVQDDSQRYAAGPPGTRCIVLRCR